LTPAQIIEEDGYDQSVVMENLKGVVTSSYIADKIHEMLSLENVKDALMYKDLAKLMNISVDYLILQRIDEENTFLNNAWRNTKSFGAGFVNGKSDNASSFSGAVVSDLTVVGDGRDFIIQTKKYLNNEEVDEFIYGLSVVGIGTTIATVFSGGLAAPAKIGVSVLKASKKTGNLSKKLLTNLTKIMDEMFDLKRFKNNLRYTDFRKIKNEVEVLFKTAKTDKMMDVFIDIKKISDSSSIADTVKLLKYADNTDDLKRLGHLSTDFGKNSRGVLTVLGKKALKVTKRIAKGIYKLTMMLVALLYSLLTSLIALVMFILKGNLFYKIKMAFRRMMGFSPKIKR
jgi:hypothetical protein